MPAGDCQVSQANLLAMQQTFLPMANNGAEKATQAELAATPQFDSGRWKLRLERIPIVTGEQYYGSLVSNIGVGFTMLSPLVCLIMAYLWARIGG